MAHALSVINTSNITHTLIKSPRSCFDMISAETGAFSSRGLCGLLVDMSASPFRHVRGKVIQATYPHEARENFFYGIMRSVSGQESIGDVAASLTCFGSVETILWLLLPTVRLSLTFPQPPPSCQFYYWTLSNPQIAIQRQA